jgi:hypothetical protein
VNWVRLALKLSASVSIIACSEKIKGSGTLLRRTPDSIDAALLWLAGDQIDGSMFAATIHFEFEVEPVTFIQRCHAGAFDCRDVDKRIRLSIVALDKAETLHRVEEFDGAAGLFTGQLALRGATKAAATFAGGRIAVARGWAIRHGKRFTFDLEIGCRNLAAAINQSETQGLPFGQSGQASLLNCGNMHKHIFAAVITDDKAKTLLPIKEFNNTSAFANDLRGHATPGTAPAATSETTAAAAETTTAATAAESVAATATKAITAAAAAEPITATGKAAAVTIAAAAAAAFVTETVALIASASAAITAATFIKTHAVPVLSSKSPACLIQETSCAGRGQNASRRNMIMRHASRDSRNPPMLRAKIVLSFIAGK